MNKNIEIKNNYLSFQINPRGCSLEKITVQNRFSPLMQLNSSKRYGLDPSLSGSIVGPYCGRIKNGKLLINNSNYKLVQNEGTTHIHGGLINLSNKTWDIISQSKNSICLQTFLRDNEQGYPGNRWIKTRYSLENKSILIEIEAKSDKDTIFNITNHAYWNLSCDFTKKIFNHKFQIPSSSFYLNDPFHIPRSSLDVNNTSFNFITSKKLKDNLSILKPKNQIIMERGYNHAFHCSSCNVEFNHISLNVSSSFPDIHLYTGGFLDENTKLINNVNATSNCAFAIEPQEINRRKITKPNEKYKQFITYTILT